MPPWNGGTVDGGNVRIKVVTGVLQVPGNSINCQQYCRVLIIASVIVERR